MRFGNINQVAAAKGGDLNLAVHAQDPFLNRRLQYQIRAAVGQQYLGNSA